MTNYELPTVPGYYVTNLGLNSNDPTNPLGATIFVYDDEEREWFEYGQYTEEPNFEPTYPEGVEAAVKRYGWELKRLVVEWD